MSAYTEAQEALAASQGGKLALEMKPGTRLRDPKGELFVVWMAWRPGDAESEERSWYYCRTRLGAEHNREIGVTALSRDHKGDSTLRIRVEDLTGWEIVS